MKKDAAPQTAILLAGGGSFGTVQAGMLPELLAYGVTPDVIVDTRCAAASRGLKPPFVEYPGFQAVWVMSAGQGRR